MKLPDYRTLAALFLAVGMLLGGCQTVPAPGFTAQQLEMLRDSGFNPVDDGWELIISEKILFGFGKDEVSRESTSYVTRLSRALLDVGLREVRIDGHTDNIGDPGYNRALSLRRANNVAAVMVSAGMPEESIITRGLGDSRPVHDNSTREGRSENRRVSIIIPSP